MPKGSNTYKNLLTNPREGESTSQWNGMIVYAMDPKSGKVYANAAADQKHDPASLNKLMILKLVLDAVDQQKIPLDKTILVTPDVQKPTEKTNWKGKEASNLKAGTEVSVADLLKGMIVASDNGAAVLLGRLLEQTYYNKTGSNPTAGEAKMLESLIFSKVQTEKSIMPADALRRPEYANAAINGKPLVDLPVVELPFVSIQKQMNQTAANLGMNDTHYANADGMPTDYDRFKNTGKAPKGWDGKDKDRNISTARDSSKLLNDIMTKYPTALEYLGKASVQYAGASEDAHHFLLDPKSPQRVPANYKVAAKTGYTVRANHNIAAHINDGDGHELIIVVMDSGRRSIAQTQRLGLGEGYKGKGELRGNRVRDALVKQLSASIFKSEHEQEKAEEKKHPKTHQEKLGHLNLDEILKATTITPISYDGPTSMTSMPLLGFPAKATSAELIKK